MTEKHPPCVTLAKENTGFLGVARFFTAQQSYVTDEIDDI